MQETWVKALNQEDPLVKRMATHSNILAWRIPWTDEPRVGCSPWGHKESDTTATNTHTCTRTYTHTHTHTHTHTRRGNHFTFLGLGFTSLKCLMRYISGLFLALMLFYSYKVKPLDILNYIFFDLYYNHQSHNICKYHFFIYKIYIIIDILTSL